MGMGRIAGFLMRFLPGDPVAKVCDTRNLNRIANILEDMTGVGIRIEKPTDAEGRGWKLINDGSSDEDNADGSGIPGDFPRPGGGEQVTFLTAWRLDKTGHYFQVKTRTGYVVDPGTESDWTNVTDANGGVLDPHSGEHA